MIVDRDFFEWLKKNKIKYDENNYDLMKALYDEFIIEKENKIINNIFLS